MNIVKGVADLIRRTSSGPIAVSGSQANWSHPPGPKIRFGYLHLSLQRFRLFLFALLYFLILPGHLLFCFYVGPVR